MKKITVCLLAMSISMSVLAHDCDCDCDKHQETPPAAPQEKSAPVTVQEKEPVTQVATGTEEKSAEKPAEKTEEKNLLQKFIDYPAATDKAKSRMKRH